MLSCTFNQDSSCFTVAREDGFQVFNSEPTSLRFERLSKKTGISRAVMLFKSNIFVLVGGGDYPQYPPNKVIIWDDFQGKPIAQLEFEEDVQGVKLKRDTLVTITTTKTYCHKMESLGLIKSWETVPNYTGIGAINIDDDPIVAYLGLEPGWICVENLLTRRIHEIQAHAGPIAALTISATGTHVATASNKGTIIRIWDSATGKMIHEFRRGVEIAKINNLCFDKNTARLLVSSEKGTVHIFSLLDQKKNRTSQFKYISEYLPSYFSSTWSTVNFQVPKCSVCAFSTNSDVDTIYTLTPSGLFQIWRYDTAEGTGVCVKSENILKD